MARTHTELYRRYEGTLRSRGLRFWPLVASGVRVACKPKIPLLLLFVPVGITTIVYSFVVYGKYAADDLTQSIGGLEGVAAMFAKRAVLNIMVADQVAQASHTMHFFAILAVTWFGAGMFAEDRRLGAHLLYFSRPLTRVDYFLGKFLTVAFFGALASLVPSLVICLVAAWSSPEWSFLKEEGGTIWRSAVFAGIWVTVLTSIVLCVSSLVRRKTLALAGVFGFVIMNLGMGQVCGFVDSRWQVVSVVFCIRRIRNWIFAYDDWMTLGFSVESAFLALGLVVAFCITVIAMRLRKLEVVA